MIKYPMILYSITIAKVEKNSPQKFPKHYNNMDERRHRISNKREATSFRNKTKYKIVTNTQTNKRNRRLISMTSSLKIERRR